MRRSNCSAPIPFSGHPWGHHFFCCCLGVLIALIFTCPPYIITKITLFSSAPPFFITHIFPLTPGLPWGGGGCRQNKWPAHKHILSLFLCYLYKKVSILESQIENALLIKSIHLKLLLIEFVMLDYLFCIETIAFYQAITVYCTFLNETTLQCLINGGPNSRGVRKILKIW